MVVKELMTSGVVTVEPNSSAALAARLLGSDVERQVSGGAVYRYSGQNGSIQFHNDGSFSARFTQGAFPTDNDPAASAAVLLERLDFTGELIKHTDDSLTFRQTWQGAPLFFNQVTLAMQDGFFTAITSGQRLGGTPTEDGTRQALPPASALIQLLHGINELGDVCSSIVGIHSSPTNLVTAPSPIVISAKEKYADCTIGTIKKISIPTIHGARKMYP